jgi:hypothetical protein
MSNTNTSGAAFPFLSYNTGDNLWYQQEGMTLRDYFAAKAMMGMCFGAPIPQKSEVKQIVERSYQVADAMLKARQNENL